MLGRGRSAERGWLQKGMIRGSMLGKTRLSGDEELGKKDDDHKYIPARPSAWSSWTSSFRWRRRRNLLIVLGLFLVFMIHRSWDALDASNELRRYPLRKPTLTTATYEKPSFKDDEPTGPPPGIQRPRAGEATPHTFGGQIRFYRLASTLRPSASHTGGYQKRNRNILFAISSLKSASALLPMICEMSTWSRNHVHAAFMGREDIPLEDLLEINGIDKSGCPAVWHDARPDYTEYVRLHFWSGEMHMECFE